MKMHLPLGLRRALLNTFIAIGAAAAMNTAQAGVTYEANTYTNNFTHSDSTGYLSGSATYTFAPEREAIYLKQGTFYIRYQQLVGYTDGDKIFNVNDEGYIPRYSTEKAHLIVSPSAGGDGVTYIEDGQVTIDAASVTFKGETYFGAGLKTSCQVSLGVNNNQWHAAGAYALYDGTNVTAIGNSKEFSLWNATSLTAYNTSVTLENGTLTTLTVNSPATVTTRQALTLTSLTMNGGELNANASITATAGTMSDGAITTTDSTLYLSGVTVSGGTITSNGSGAITTGAVSGGTIMGNGTGAITALGNVTGGTFSGQSITLGSATTTVKDTNNPLVISGGTLNLNGATTLTNTASSVNVNTLNVNADTQLTHTVEIASATNIDKDSTLTLSGVQDGNLGEVGNNGTASTGGLTLAGNTTAGATMVQVGTLTVMGGSELTASGGSITSTVGGIVYGGITASNITLAGVVKGAANLEATQKLDLTSATVSTTAGSVLHGNDIVLNATAGSKVTNGKVHADTSLNVGAGLMLDGGTGHELGKVTGTQLQLTGNAEADSASVNVGILGVASGSTLNSSGDITASTKANLNGTVSTSCTLSVAEGSAENGTLTAEAFTNTGNFTIAGGKLDFDTTTVGTGTRLTITETLTEPLNSASDLGNVTVSGTGTVLDMDINGEGINGNITVSNGGKLELTGTYSDADTAATHKGNITANNAGTVELTSAKVEGSVTLEGAGDTLNMTNSAITGTLTAGEASTVTVKGDNTAGELVLDANSVLNYSSEGATLTADVAVRGDSTANIGQTGLTGDLNVVEGTGNIAAGAQVNGNVNLYEGEVAIGDNATVTGNITLSDGNDSSGADRLLTIEGNFSMAKGTDLNINTHAGTDHTGSNSIAVESGTFHVEDLMGTGNVTLTGEGDISFDGTDSDHSGDIVSNLSEYSFIKATETNSLGTAGALVLENTRSFLSITADQVKDIAIGTGTPATAYLTTEGKDVTLSGAVTGDTLHVTNAELTLTGENDLDTLEVNGNAAVTTTDGTYHNVTNNGELTMENSTLGNLVNNNEATATDTEVLAGSSITNKGELNLNNVSNAKDEHDRDTVAGTLENNGTLNITGSELNVTNAQLGGTVTMADSADNSTVTTLTSTDGTTVTGTVLGEGNLVSEGTVSVTGNIGTADDDFVGNITAPTMVVDAGLVNLQGTVTTDTLTATNGGNITITGDGDADNASASSLGQVSLSDGSSLALKADSFTGDVNSRGDSTLSMEQAALTGKLEAEADSELVLTADNSFNATEASSIAGAVSGTGTLTKTGENLTLSGADATPTSAGDYRIVVAGAEATSTAAPNTITLDNTQRNGTLEAAANTDIVLTNGQSSVGNLVVFGDGNAAHNTPSANATHVVVEVGGRDSIASATGAALSARDANTGKRGAQIIIRDWSVANTFTGYADGQMLLIGKGVTGFDKEIVHNLETQNVNLVEVNGNSYAAVNINHKGARKNDFEQGVSDAVTSTESIATGRLDEMLHALSHTVSEQGAKDALNSIGGAGIATTMAAQMSANRDHMRTLRHSIGQPEPLPYESILGTAIRRTAGTARENERQLQFPTRLWAMATGSSSDLGTDSQGGVGYTRNDWGFLVGSDVTLSNTSLVGLAAGYSRSHVDSYNHTISGDEYFVDLYTRVNTCRFSHSATLGVGFFDWDLDRSVHVHTADLYEDFYGNGKGQTKGMAFNFSYEVAYNIQLAENHTLAPVFQLESSFNHIGSYREGGTLGNAGLDVDFDNAFVTTLGLGLRYSYEFEGFNNSRDKGSLGARAMLIGDVGDTCGTMRGRFIGGGQRFDGESTKIGRKGLLLGVDALVPVSEDWAVFGNADIEVRDDYRDISAGIGARYTF